MRRPEAEEEAASRADLVRQLTAVVARLQRAKADAGPACPALPAGEVPDQALLATMEQAVACAERVSLK